MSNNLTLRTLTSPYGDNTKGSVLSQEELDSNFIFLKGLDISGVELSNENLIIRRINGEVISLNLSQFQGPVGPEGKEGPQGPQGEQGPQGPSSGGVVGASYTYTTGVLTLINSNGTNTEVYGFITGGTADSTLGTLTLGNSDGTNILINGFSTGVTPTYTNLTPTTATLGGIPAGSTFSNKTFQEMFDDLLYPYLVPAFTSFNRTNLSSPYDLGEPIIIGLETFSWAATNTSNISGGTLSIEQLSPSTTTLMSNSNYSPTSTGITTTIDISSSTPTTLNLYRISAKNTNGATFTSTISATWKYRWYYGKSSNTTVDVSEITGVTFNSALVSNVVNSYVNFSSSVTPEYGYLIVPTGLSQPSDLRNSTSGCFGSNIPYSNLGTITFDNVYGISTTYNIYRTTNGFAGSQNVWLCS